MTPSQRRHLLRLGRLNCHIEAQPDYAALCHHGVEYPLPYATFRQMQAAGWIQQTGETALRDGIWRLTQAGWDAYLQALSEQP